MDLVANPGIRKVSLTWQPPKDDRGSPVNRYLVYSAVNPNGFDLGSNNGLGTSRTVDGLEDNTTYWFKVVAINDVGEGDPTIVSAKTFSPPTAVGSISLETGDGSVTLSWEAPLEDGGTLVTSYWVYRGINEGTLERYVELPPDPRVYLDLSVENGRTYIYQISPVNEVGEGPLSQRLEGTPTGPPSQPMGMEGEQLNSTIVLRWAPPEKDGGLDIIGYIIHRSVGEADPTLLAKLAPVLEYTDVDIEMGMIHSYTVTARNAAGLGMVSETVYVYPSVPVSPPSPPMDLNAFSEDSTVHLIWAPPLSDGGSKVTGYIVFRGATVDDLHELCSVGPILEFVDDDVEEGSSYHYAVAAENVAGTGERTDTFSITMEIDNPDGTLPWYPLLIVIVIGCIMAIGAGTALSTEAGRYRLGLLTLPLLGKAGKEDVLDNRVRYGLHGIIVERPGIHYGALLKEFDLRNGAAAYHLDVLEKEHFIKSVRDGRMKRFYSTNTRIPEDLRATPEEVREQIHVLVRERPGIAQKEIIEELGIDRDTVGYHLREMVKGGQLKNSREGKYTVYRIAR